MSQPATVASAAEAFAPSLAAAVAYSCEAVSHNLNGQKLGRKGRYTRERILAATLDLLEAPDDEPITLAAVARNASLGLSALYNYFTDLTELVLAVLEPVMATSEDAYVRMVRDYWSDEQLGERCQTFVSAYHRFWARHTRLLHLRNAMADQDNRRMMVQRVESTQPIIALIVAQMDGDVTQVPSPASSMATMAMIGIERSVTISTDRKLPALMGWSFSDDGQRFIQPGARLLELAIRDARVGATQS